jgi:hypothetical protein
LSVLLATLNAMPSELPPHLREPRIEETVLDLTQLATTAEAARNGRRGSFGITRILRD